MSLNGSGINSICIGKQASGLASCGNASINIGNSAGYGVTSATTANSINIGSYAGHNYNSGAIILNASGAALDSSVAGLVVKPVRTNEDNTNGILQYNATTFEITKNSMSLPSSTIVGISDTQTLTNKTLTNPTINTINSLSLPSSSVVGINDTQTLTNKTLTSPIVTSEATPSTATGKQYFDSTSNLMRYYDGTNWNNIYQPATASYYTSAALSFTPSDLTTWIDTGITASITLKAGTTNVMLTVSGGVSSGTVNYYAFLKVQRSVNGGAYSDIFLGDTYGTRKRCFIDIGNSLADYDIFSKTFARTVLDLNPAAGTKNIVIAYKIQLLRSYPSGSTVILGASHNNATADRSSQPTMMTLQETF